MIVNAQVTPPTNGGRRKVADTRWVRNMAAFAIANGAERYSLFEVRWTVAADCLNPARVLYEGRPEGRAFTHPGAPTIARREHTRYADGFDHDTPMSLLMLTRCRKCEKCLRARANHWYLRAKGELACSERSWFGTLTLRPEEHYLAELRARAECARKSVAFDTLPPWEKFAHLHRANGPELTKWLKRIRKESGATLRYILVAEAHKSGLPHYHVLVHERGHVPVRERTLRLQWTLGHSKFNLVDGDPRSARYVCKYLAKAAEARVRASQHYGLLRS